MCRVSDWGEEKEGKERDGVGLACCSALPSERIARVSGWLSNLCVMVWSLSGFGRSEDVWDMAVHAQRRALLITVPRRDDVSFADRLLGIPITCIERQEKDSAIC